MAKEASWTIGAYRLVCVTRRKEYRIYRGADYVGSTDTYAEGLRVIALLQQEDAGKG